MMKELSLRVEEYQKLLDIELERVKLLERILRDHGIEVPPPTPAELLKMSSIRGAVSRQETLKSLSGGLLPDANIQNLIEAYEKTKLLIKRNPLTISFHNLSLWSLQPPESARTVGSAIKRALCGSGPKVRKDILRGLSGTIPPRTMTLVLGPPSSGKTAFMKLLSGRLKVGGALRQEGEVLYNGEVASEERFSVPKIIDYIDQDDVHAPTLTVFETLEFAFRCTTGGHHSYALAKDEESAEILNTGDEQLNKVVIDRRHTSFPKSRDVLMNALYLRCRT